MTTVLNSLNEGLHRAFAQDDRVLILGEDILDPYGGAFKVTKGLSTLHPDRVLSSPISEAGIVGIAAGMAMRGMLPVVEIMFGDFITLATDQIVNHITKFKYMYNDQVEVPVVIRTPMGGRRGYGATHSQTLEKLFLGVPGLVVLAPTAFGNPGELLEQAILNENDPVLFIENKLLYTRPLNAQATSRDFKLTVDRNEKYPVYTITIADAPSSNLTISAYGYMAELAREAMLQLAYQHEIFAELIVPTQLAPFQPAPIIKSSQTTGALLTIEEGTYSMGWGAEVISQVAEESANHRIKFHRLAANEHPIPAAKTLEEASLPGIVDIINSALSLI